MKSLHISAYTYICIISMTTLLLIDCQKDFHPGGSLAVPNADADAARITQFIRQNTPAIHRIVATMDSHHPLHIAHPCFWSDQDGNSPTPFTVISTEDIVSGKWTPREDIKPSAREDLLIALQAKKPKPTADTRKQETPGAKAVKLKKAS